MSDENFIGKTFDSNNFGKFRVLRRIYRILPGDYRNQKRAWYEIEFLETGYKTLVRSDAISKGKVKDLFRPSIYGVGYPGGRFNVRDPKFTSLYRVWNQMLNRCYSPNSKDYQNYGAIGVTVDPSWFNFGNFYQDAINLPGYENKQMYPNDYNLDKDYLQMNIPKSQRVYSKNTCVWLSKHDNSTLMIMERSTDKQYYGVDLRNRVYTVRIGDIRYCKFNTAEAAANMYNYLYSVLNKNSQFILYNDVEIIPLDNLVYYAARDSEEVINTINFIKNNS